MGKLIGQSVFSGVILPLCAAMTAVACADEVLQSQIDEVTPKMYFDYLKGGPTDKAALQRLDAAFDKVLREVRETVVTDKPAIWFVYNMGVVVKTKESCFSIDLQHRKAPEIAPFLDFALITHRHGDHFTEEFYRAMDGAGKTVISNFKDNAGAMSRQAECGLTKGNRTFKLKDVEIRTALADHSKSKVDFTTTFEIRIGGLLLFHSGDCSDVSKLNPSRSPDLWLVHPYCGMKTEDGVKKFSPKLTAILHLNELGHARTGCRWTWEAGLKAKAKAEEAGGVAVVPVWGDRICKSVCGSERIGCAGAEISFVTCKAQEEPPASLPCRAYWNQSSRPSNIHWFQWQRPNHQKVEGHDVKAVSPSVEVRLFIVRAGAFRDVVFGGICNNRKAR